MIKEIKVPGSMKQLTVNKANNTVRCPLVEKMQKVGTCKSCKQCFQGFDHNDEDQFVVLCTYIKQTAKEKIITILSQARDFHPNSLEKIADEIVRIFEK